MYVAHVLYYHLICPYLCIWILDLHMHPKARGGWKEGTGLLVPQLSPVLSFQTDKQHKHMADYIQQGALNGVFIL